MLAGSPPSTIAAGMRVCCQRAGALFVVRAAFMALPVHNQGALIHHLQAVHAHIAHAGLRVARDHLRQGDKPPAVFRPAFQDRQEIQRRRFRFRSLLAPVRCAPCAVSAPRRAARPAGRARGRSACPSPWAGAGRSALPSRSLSSSRSSTSSAQAMRCADPKALISTGMS